MVWRKWLLIPVYLGLFFFTKRNYYSDYIIQMLFSSMLVSCKQQGLVWTPSSLLHTRGSMWGCKTVWSWDRSAQKWIEGKKSATEGCIQQSYDIVLQLWCYFPNRRRMQSCAQQMVYFNFADVTYSISLLENSGHSGKSVLGRNIVGIELSGFASHCMCNCICLLNSFRFSALLGRLDVV